MSKRLGDLVPLIRLRPGCYPSARVLDHIVFDLTTKGVKKERKSTRSHIGGVTYISSSKRNIARQLNL